VPLLAGCGGEHVVLGERPPFHFSEVVLVSELAFGSENPTLTADLLEIYFTSSRPDDLGDTGGNVWVARRSSAQAPFEPPVPVSELNTPAFETSAAVSADGLTLWVGSDRAGGLGDLDVWRSSRSSRTAPWSPPVDVAELNSLARDLPRPLGDHGRTMPLSSQRSSPNSYQTFLAVREAPTLPFASPAPIPELAFPDRSTVDAFLSDDGLILFFSSGSAGAKADLYVALRRSTSEPFSASGPLFELNTAAEERDPWLSPDGTKLFFVSDRDGPLSIYQATATAATP
jgi:hypothetical protein